MTTSTVSVKNIKGINCIIPNTVPFVSTDKTFFISYNNYDTNVYGTDTTALVIGQGSIFLVLNGNWVAKFNQLIVDIDNKDNDKIFDIFLDFVYANRKSLNKYSDKINDPLEDFKNYTNKKRYEYSLWLKDLA